MTTTTDISPTRTGAAQGGPPLAVPAVAFALLTVGTAVIGGSGPGPGTDAAAVLAYDAAHPAAIGLQALLLVGSAFPLVVYAATALRRLQRLGVQAPGPLMGLTGAVLAAVGLTLSGIAGWVGAHTAELGDAPLSRALAWLAFGAGGVGFAAPMGLLVLGLAIPTLIMRLVPRWLSVTGVVIGGLALLSTFSLVTDVLYPLLPVGRFGGTLMLLAFAFTLPTARRAAR